MKKLLSITFLFASGYLMASEDSEACLQAMNKYTKLSTAYINCLQGVKNPAYCADHKKALAKATTAQNKACGRE